MKPRNFTGLAKEIFDANSYIIRSSESERRQLYRFFNRMHTSEQREATQRERVSQSTRRLVGNRSNADILAAIESFNAYQNMIPIGLVNETRNLWERLFGESSRNALYAAFGAGGVESIFDWLHNISGGVVALFILGLRALYLFCSEVKRLWQRYRMNQFLDGDSSIDAVRGHYNFALTVTEILEQILWERQNQFFDGVIKTSANDNNNDPGQNRDNLAFRAV